MEIKFWIHPFKENAYILLSFCLVFVLLK